MARIVKEPDKVYKCHTCGCEFIPEANEICFNDEVFQGGVFLGVLPGWVFCNSTRCPRCKAKVIMEWL